MWLDNSFFWSVREKKRHLWVDAIATESGFFQVHIARLDLGLQVSKPLGTKSSNSSKFSCCWIVGNSMKVVDAANFKCVASVYMFLFNCYPLLAQGVIDLHYREVTKTNTVIYQPLISCVFFVFCLFGFRTIFFAWMREEWRGKRFQQENKVCPTRHRLSSYLDAENCPGMR